MFAPSRVFHDRHILAWSAISLSSETAILVVTWRSTFIGVGGHQPGSLRSSIPSCSIRRIP